MSQELQLGKYEFYPYEFDEDGEVPSLEELLEFLKSPAKAKTGKDVKTPSRSLDRSHRHGPLLHGSQRRDHDAAPADNRAL